MTVTVKGIGTYASGATPTPSPPGTVLAADRSIMFVSAKYAGTAVIGAVTNWTEVARNTGDLAAGSGTGNDVGATEIVAYVRDGAYSGAQSLNISGHQNAMAVIIVFQKTLGAWSTLASASGDDTSGGGATFSAGCTSNPGWTAGDAVCAGIGIPTDAGTALASPSITATGISAGTTQNTTYAETAVGTDAAAAAITRDGVSGTALASPTVGITFTGATNTYGPTVLVRLRDESAGQDLAIGFLDNTESLFSPTLANQSPLELSVGFHDNAESLFSPSFVKDLEVPHLASAAQLFSPTFVKDLEISLLDNVESFFALTFVKDLETGHIASTLQFFAPTLENAGGGAQDIFPAFHQQSTGFFVMSLSNQAANDLEVGHLASGAQIFAPTIESQSALSVAPSRIESTAQLFTPTLVNELSVNPARIESTVQLFAPTLVNQSPLNLDPGFITSTLVIPAPTLSLQVNLNLAIPFVQFVPMFFSPSLVNEGGDLFEPILAGNGSLIDQVINGLITQGFLTGTVTDRERLRLLNRALLADPQNLSMMDLYRINAEPNRLYEIGIDVL